MIAKQSGDGRSKKQIEMRALLVRSPTNPGNLFKPRGKPWGVRAAKYVSVSERRT